MQASDSDDVNYVVFSVDYDTTALTKISSLIDEGALKPLVTRKIPVSELKTAHESYLKGENNGKIIVVVDPSMK